MGLGWGERQILPAGGMSQLVVPAGEPGLIGLSHHERGRELHSVVRAASVACGQVSRAPHDLRRDLRDRDAAPELVYSDRFARYPGAVRRLPARIRANAE